MQSEKYGIQIVLSALVGGVILGLVVGSGIWAQDDDDCGVNENEDCSFYNEEAAREAGYDSGFADGFSQLTDACAYWTGKYDEAAPFLTPRPTNTPQKPGSTPSPNPWEKYGGNQTFIVDAATAQAGMSKACAEP